MSLEASPHVVGIYTSPNEGEPMVRHTASVTVLADRGIAGDRYALEKGKFSGNGEKIRHVTIISRLGIEQANLQLLAEGKQPFTAAETRRNFVLANYSPEQLEALIGQEFEMGTATLVGVEPAIPCTRPGTLLEREGLDFKFAFVGRGGIRAAALGTGVVTLGSPLRLL